MGRVALGAGSFAAHNRHSLVPSRLDLVSERIRSLLAAPTDGRGAPQREDLEEALTGGYAEALALDGERLRLEREIDQVTAKLARGGQNRPAELRRLMARLDEAEDDLAALRRLLLALRQRAAKAA
jgi:hypothetical protein